MNSGRISSGQLARLGSVQQSASDVDPSQPQARAIAAVPSVRRQQVLMLAALFVIATFAAILATRAAGQNTARYKSIPMHEKLKDPKRWSQYESDAKIYASSGSGNPNSIRIYCEAYLPARMTAPDGAEHLSELGDDARNIIARAQKTNPQVLRAVNESMYRGMRRVAEGEYHPAARINAITLLSRLDSTPAITNRQRPPVPLSATLPIFVKIYNDENEVDGVRAAALHAMHRYVNYGFAQMTPEYRAGLSKIMNQLLESDPPKGRSEQAHAYLQRFAVDILYMLQAKDDSSLGEKLVSISSETSKPDLIALYSAARIGSLGDSMKNKVADPAKILNSWSRRILNAYEGELARLKALTRPDPAKNQPAPPEDFIQKPGEAVVVKSSGAAGGFGGGGGLDMDVGAFVESGPAGGGFGGGGGMNMVGDVGNIEEEEVKPQPPEVTATRRKLNYVLQQLHVGATGQPKLGAPGRNARGLIASVSEEKRDAVEQWLRTLQPIVEATNDNSIETREEFMKELELQIEALQTLVGESDGDVEVLAGDELAVLK